MCLQTLEDSVLKEADSLTLRGEQEGDPPTKVPAKVQINKFLLSLCHR